jgi:hypothetical protein
MISALRRVIAAVDPLRHTGTSFTRQAGRQSLAHARQHRRWAGAGALPAPFVPIGHSRRAKLGAAAPTHAAGRKKAPGHRQASRPLDRTLVAAVPANRHGRRAGACWRASWDGLAPHPWPSDQPRTYRERNQVTIIGSAGRKYLGMALAGNPTIVASRTHPT